ncbi:DUF2852 domain-containing protein [Methylopila sp. M107]|uniref:DUF2852 domain-containing protein n=1 Tax=Methylopila sp. M107 TaxID=1101190 RepID=UPI000360F9DC|nr:DUF2852 domain-containing protein [Methylopila sp. M107]
MTSNPPIDDSASAIPGVPHRWNALTIALTVIGFIVFWPLGLAMILYVLCGEQILNATRRADGPLAQARKAAEDFGRNVRDEFKPRGSTTARDYARSYGFGASRRTGNAAFDAWREAEEKRIDEERRKLDETTAAFEAHLRTERGQFDDSRQREEFDRFMHGRNG